MPLFSCLYTVTFKGSQLFMFKIFAKRHGLHGAVIIIAYELVFESLALKGCLRVLPDLLFYFYSQVLN